MGLQKQSHLLYLHPDGLLKYPSFIPAENPAAPQDNFIHIAWRRHIKLPICVLKARFYCSLAAVTNEHGFLLYYMCESNNRTEQQLIRHAAIWKKEKKNPKGSWITEKERGKNSSREKPVGVWLANHTLEKQSLKTTNMQQKIHLIISVSFFLGRVQKWYKG